MAKEVTSRRELHESLEERERRSRLSNSLPGSPKLSSDHVQGWTGPRGHMVQPPLAGLEPGALEQKGLSQVQSVWSQVHSRMNTFLSLFQPFHIQHSPRHLPHPYPRYNCSSQEQPTAWQLKKRLLLSKLVYQTCILEEAFPPQATKNGLTNARRCELLSPFLAQGFQSRLQVQHTL